MWAKPSSRSSAAGPRVKRAKRPWKANATCSYASEKPTRREEEQTRSSLALAFPEIGSAWQFKEDLRSWYETAEASTAASGLDAWITRVKANGPAELRKALSAFRH